MQIELIETFLDLCETRNFNRTAERLGVTQSTVSGRMRALEAKVGSRLLSRSRSGTEPTTEGLRFEPYARSLLAFWTEGRRAVRNTGDTALNLRIGIQHDLVASHAGEWVDTLRRTLPETAFYVEADYSAQICSDVMSGALDIGVIYTPKPHPNLHFETLGEVTYRMVSTDTDQLAGVRAERYILPNYAPAFARAHDDLLPHLSQAPLSSGQNIVVAGLFAAMGGATYLRSGTARELVEAGACRLVTDAPRISQSVFSVVQLRYRHRALHRRMVQLIREQTPGRGLGWQSG